MLHECPAAKIRSIAGAAGWDLGGIPDGLDETGIGVRRPIVESAIDGLWMEYADETRIVRVRLFAFELLHFYAPKGMVENVQTAIIKIGFRFENGDFVPVNAIGKIPE